MCPRRHHPWGQQKLLLLFICFDCQFGVLEALITDCEVVSTKNAVGLYQNSSRYVYDCASALSCCSQSALFDKYCCFSGFSIVVVDENPPAEFERRAKLVGLQGQVCPDGDFHRSDPSGRIQRFEALYSKWESLEAQCGILHMQNDDEVLIQVRVVRTRVAGGLHSLTLMLGCRGSSPSKTTPSKTSASRSRIATAPPC